MTTRATREDRIARLDRELRRLAVLRRQAVLHRGGRRQGRVGGRTRAEPA